MPKPERTKFTLSVSDKTTPLANGRVDAEITFEVLDDGKPLYRQVQTISDLPVDVGPKLREIAISVYGEWPVNRTVTEKELVKIKRKALKAFDEILDLAERRRSA